MDGTNNIGRANATTIFDPYQISSPSSSEKPPLSVVVVRGQPWASPAVVGPADLSSNNMLEYDPPGSEAGVGARAHIPPQATSFRLQPRTRPGLVSGRGRKRTAQCLTSYSPSARAADVSGDAEVMTKSVFSTSPSSFQLPRGPSLCVESEMESLSIRSPRAQASPMPMTVSISASVGVRSRVTPARSTLGSSFVSYSSPSGGASACLRPRTNSIGSQSSSMLHASSPASSTRSSPRIAPLTVLTRGGCSNEGGTPQKRPPLHGRPAGMLLSLDGAIPATPNKLSSSVTCSPEITSTPERNGMTISSPGISYSCETPPTKREDHRMKSQSPYCTPLPRVRLTPRASSEKARELELLPADFVDSTNLSSQMETPASFDRPSSYLPIPDWCMDAPVARHQPSPTTSFGAFDWFPPNKSKSVFDSASNMDFIQEMASEQARAAAMDADGSLSDPDEEDPFVLADPAALAQDRFPTGPARQRQRLSYSSLEQHSLRHSGTSNSLSHTHASNTSLLGIDFLRNDSVMSLSMQALTGSGSRTPQGITDGPVSAETEAGGALDQGDRNLSEGSLESIGLALEPSNEFHVAESTRDFVTPPPIPHDATAMPLSRPKFSHLHQNVRISGSSAAAIDQTIASMACQERPASHYPSPRTRCYG